jgi:hypothetical protein
MADTNKLSALLAKLDFQPENLILEAAGQASLFKQAADYRIACYRDLAASEMNLDVARAQKELDTRAEAEALDKKITENGVKARLEVDQDVSAFRAKYNKARERDEYSKLVAEAFRMRSKMIEVVQFMSVQDPTLRQSSVDAANRQLDKVKSELRAKYRED